MYFKLRLVPTAVATLLVAACGGGGGGGSSSVASNPSSGIAVDGYLSFSQVACDSNENGVADAGEPVAYTTTTGKFTFPSGCAHSLLVSGGSSVDTGKPLVGILRAPANSAVVTPFTTLLASGMTPAQVIATMRLDPAADIGKLDPAAVDGSGNLLNPTVYRKSLALQQILQKVSEMLTSLAGAGGTATTNSIYSQVGDAFAGVLKTGGSLLSSDTTVDADVVKALVQAATQNVSSSTKVDSSVSKAVAGTDAASLALVTTPAYANQIDSILGAGSSAAAIAVVAAAKQSSTFVADFVGAYKSTLQSGSNTSQAVLTSLGKTVASTDAAGGNTLD